MKLFKKGLAIMLSLVMTLSMLTIVSAGSAATVNQEAWRTDAVKSPTDGKLVGAGYIRIDVKTNLENAKKYYVMVDGNKIGEIDNPEFEISSVEYYSTEVVSHQLYVTAILENNESVVSTITKFYVSKKGIGLGEDMSSTVRLEQMNMSWYYNWNPEPFNDSRDKNVDHMPMIWGRDQDDPLGTQDDHLMSYIEQQAKLVGDEPNYVLGYNEPDLPAQANMTRDQGLAAWPYVEATGKRLVSPVVSNPNGTYNGWLTPFVNGGTVSVWNDATQSVDNIEVVPGKCDSVALHIYMSERNLQRVKNSVEAMYQTYHKPIWITELGIGGNKAYGDNYDFSYFKEGENEKTGQFLKEVCEYLDSVSYVERYSWFSYNINSANEIDTADASGSTALFDYDSGKLTDNGFIYASLGVPDDYPQYELTEDDKFVYVEPETTQQITTQMATQTATVAPTAQKQTVPATTKVLNKVKKTKITSLKNVKKKTVKISWKKIAGAKKYQLQYSTNKKFKKAVTKTPKKVSFKIKKLKKKTYFFRVRAVIGNKKGPWSDVKKVKVTK